MSESVGYSAPLTAMTDADRRQLVEAFTTYQSPRAFSPNTISRRRLSLNRSPPKWRRQRSRPPPPPTSMSSPPSSEQRRRHAPTSPISPCSSDGLSVAGWSRTIGCSAQTVCVDRRRYRSRRRQSRSPRRSRSPARPCSSHCCSGRWPASGSARSPVSTRTTSISMPNHPRSSSTM